MPGKKKVADAAVKIPALSVERFTLRLNGTSPLIVHAWSEKAKREMLDKQMGRPSLGRENKRPFQDFLGSLYWMCERPAALADVVEETPEAMKALAKCRFGFPARGIKAAAVDSAVTCGIAKTEVRRAFQIPCDLVEIHGEPVVMREDVVRVGMGTADIRHRGQFVKWHMLVPIAYRPDCLNRAQIINLFNLAGFSTGLGEWRVERDGTNGAFEVAGKAV